MPNKFLKVYFIFILLFKYTYKTVQQLKIYFYGQKTLKLWKVVLQSSNKSMNDIICSSGWTMGINNLLMGHDLVRSVKFQIRDKGFFDFESIQSFSMIQSQFWLTLSSNVDSVKKKMIYFVLTIPYMIYLNTCYQNHSMDKANR